MRRLATLLVFAVGAALGCGPRPPAGAAQEPEPHATAAATAAPLSDAADVYRSMGFIVAGAPLPFVATIRYLRTAASDSTLAVFALSLADHSLSFRRDGNAFVAQYHVEVTFGSDTSPVRQLVSDEVVRVRTFQETLRADESVIYQRFVGLRPGVYPISVAVRDRNSPASGRQARTDTVPSLAGRAIGWPIPVYQGEGRARLGEQPTLLLNPRATVPYGADSLRFYVETYGMPRGTRLAARALDQMGVEVWRDTVPLAGDATLATARLVVHPGELSVGRGRLELGAVGVGTEQPVTAPFLVSFSDQWAITNFDQMISLLRYFERQDWLVKLKRAAPAERPAVWRDFYKTTDPVPMTPENEALDEYFRRVQTANARFQEGADQGWLTDRGQVFITLGEPDDVFDFSSDVARTGLRGIRWTYNQLRLTLFFQDQTGFGRFKLTPLSRGEYERALIRVRHVP